MTRPQCQCSSPVHDSSFIAPWKPDPVYIAHIVNELDRTQEECARREDTIRRLKRHRDQARDDLEGARQDLARAEAQRRANLSWMAGQDLDIGGLKEQLAEARAEAKQAQWGWDQASNAWGRVQAMLPRQPLESATSLVQQTLDQLAALTAEVERLRAERHVGGLEEALWQVLRQSAPHPYPDNLVDAVQQLCNQALSAVQALPDVGPVTRRDWPDGHSSGLVETIPDLVNTYGAAGVKHAVDDFAAYDREAEERTAADTRADDEVQELAAVLAAADGNGFDSYAVMARAAIAHRARTHGEGA